MFTPTPFRRLSWLALLYLWEATEPLDVASSLNRAMRDPIRAELSKALWLQAAKLDGGDGDFHMKLLENMKVSKITVEAPPAVG